MTEKSYRTIAKEAKASFIEKKSEFIGSIAPVQTEEEALAFIEKISRECRDARHNVYAYILRKNNTIRHSDAGEPKGTAGLPALEVLQKAGVTDVALVVTRYFGGILLGASGLVRAYSRSAAEALAAAGIVTMQPCTVVLCSVPYNYYNRVQQATEGRTVLDSDFGADVTLTYLLPGDEVDAFADAIREATYGEGAVEVMEHRFAPL